MAETTCRKLVCDRCGKEVIVENGPYANIIYCEWTQLDDGKTLCPSCSWLYIELMEDFWKGVK